jgi:large subunit ribosomal protein L15
MQRFSFLRSSNLVVSTPKFFRTFSSGIMLQPDEVAMNNLRDIDGARQKPIRVGRGIGSTKGKTCGRGYNGQRARSGDNLPYMVFEGGQTNFVKRAPKFGFTNPHRTPFTPLNLGKLQFFIDSGRIDISSDVLTIEAMREAGIFGKLEKGGLKVLSDGNVSVPLQIECHAISKKAMEKLKLVGGNCVLVSK